MLITSHSSNKNLVKYISPYSPSNSFAGEESITAPFTGRLAKVTAFRRGLCSQINASPNTREYGYLTNWVEWKWESEAWVMYVR